MEEKNVDLKDSVAHLDEIQKGLRREIDSLDDFEHLGHDSSPLLEDTSSDLLLASTKSARDVINNGVEISAATAANLSEELSSFDPLSSSEKMDSNLLEMGDSFPVRKDDDDKLDKFLQDLAPSAPPKHEEPPEIQNKDNDVKSATQQFMDLEREPLKKEEVLEKYSDSEDDDFKPSKYEGFQKVNEILETNDHFKTTDTFKDVEEEIQPEPPKKDYPTIPEPVPESKRIEDLLPPPQQKLVCRLPIPPEETKTTPAVKKGGAIDAEAIFCKMGLGKYLIN